MKDRVSLTLLQDTLLRMWEGWGVVNEMGKRAKWRDADFEDCFPI